MLFALLFGLSMDYQVFLLSRIKERFDQTGDTREAVGYGVGRTAGIITGAAAIMVCVFGGMATGEMVVFQQMGFGLAVAILIDATVVRTIVVPATMELLGDRNWYLPRWLEWLPNVSIEGRRAPEAQDEAGAAQPGEHTPQSQPGERAPETGKGRSRREPDGGLAPDTRNPAWNPTPASERARTD
jgi:RND superfamily putative drug exporter